MTEQPEALVTIPRKVLMLALEALESCDYSWDHIGGDEFQTARFSEHDVEKAIHAINEVLTPIEEFRAQMGYRLEGGDD